MKKVTSQVQGHECMSLVGSGYLIFLFYIPAVRNSKHIFRNLSVCDYLASASPLTSAVFEKGNV